MTRVRWGDSPPAGELDGTLRGSHEAGWRARSATPDETGSEGEGEEEEDEEDLEDVRAELAPARKRWTLYVNQLASAGAAAKQLKAVMGMGGKKQPQGPGGGGGVPQEAARQEGMVAYVPSDDDEDGDNTDENEDHSNTDRHGGADMRAAQSAWSSALTK
jgi:hypothetical protein